MTILFILILSIKALVVQLKEALTRHWEISLTGTSLGYILSDINVIDEYFRHGILYLSFATAALVFWGHIEKRFRKNKGGDQ